VASRVVRIATRASALALWQANHVAASLRDEAQPFDLDLDVELVEVSTEGDRRTDVPLAVIGGKGVFVKEVQAAVLDGRADLAVHSAKDLPAVTPAGLVIAAIPRRADARDVLVGASLAELGPGSVVATGSPRRRAQLADLVPGLRFEELRGNIDTRLGKASDFDAIVMAAAALDRLDRRPDRVERLDPDVFVPQVGQGALAVECRADDEEMLRVLDGLDDLVTRREVDCERAFLTRLGGDCDLPAGAHATLDDDDRIMLRAVLGAGPLHRVTLQGFEPVPLGTEAADRLLDLTGGA